MVFVSSDLPPSKSSEPDIGKLNFDSCTFSNNYVSEDIGATSCVHIDKTAQRTYPWLSVRFYSSTFTQNSGKVTSAIYFDEGIVSWLIMDTVEFTVYVERAEPGRMAQVIYKKDQYGFLKVTDSTFTCSNTYDGSVIKFYDQASVFGRPSLFRIKDTGETVRLD